MKKEHSGLWFAAATIFAAAVYSIILLASKKEMDLYTWTAYGFTMIAFLILIGNFCVGRNAMKEYPMLNLPLNMVTVIYFVIQFAYGGIAVMVIPGLSVTLTFYIEFLLLAAYIVVWLIMRVFVGHIQKQDENDYQTVYDMRYLAAEIETIEKMVVDQDVRKQLKALRETFQYSDPVSSAQMQVLEERIRDNVSLLREEAEDGEFQKVSVRVEKIESLMIERNSKNQAAK